MDETDGGGERLDDRALLRLIKQWLKAGVLDTDGTVVHPATGTPHGGVVSPILANMSLHYALDLWCECESCGTSEPNMVLNASVAVAPRLLCTEVTSRLRDLNSKPVLPCSW